MKKTVLIFGAIILTILVIFTLRFIIGGLEDIWICADNKWIKHGVPGASEPTEPCGQEIDCTLYGVKDCPPECVVCPPCLACSSFSCQTENFCAGLGIDRSWYQGIQDRVSNFSECVAAGNPVMESYPRQCQAGDKTFSEEISGVNE